MRKGKYYEFHELENGTFCEDEYGRLLMKLPWEYFNAYMPEEDSIALVQETLRVKVMDFEIY